jgi:hypothetical protein
MIKGFVKFKSVLIMLGILLLMVTAAAQEGNSTAEIKKKLKALDDAYQAGILEKNEYLSKKANLEKQLQQASGTLDAAVREKLKALESAKNAGILSETEYQQKKAQLLGQSAPQTDFKTGPTKVRIPTKQGKTYRHPTGFSFWYPANWSTRIEGELLLLVPNDQQVGAQGPNEAYIVNGESVAGQGIYSADDPRVTQYLDQIIMSILPTLQRTGSPTPIKMIQGQGVLVNWEGSNYQGQKVEARAYVAIINNVGVSLVALGLKGLLAKREADLHKIFESFAFGQGEKDPNLMGRWQLFATSSLTNQSPFETDWSRASMVSDKNSIMEFRADGTWLRTDKSHLLVIAGGSYVEDKSIDSSGGRWYASNGVLIMIWKNNSWEEYKYQILQTPQGRQLRMVCGNSGQVWKGI